MGKYVQQNSFSEERTNVLLTCHVLHLSYIVTHPFSFYTRLSIQNKKKNIVAVQKFPINLFMTKRF